MFVRGNGVIHRGQKPASCARAVQGVAYHCADEDEEDEAP